MTNVTVSDTEVSFIASVLVVGSIKDYPAIGDRQTPLQTLAVQALRNTRCVEEIAHGRSSPLGLSRSSNPMQYAASGGGCLRFRAGRRSNPAAGGFDQQAIRRSGGARECRLRHPGR